mgnify:CR=1 FL=1
MSDDEEPRADWGAWSLQYGLGFVVGGIAASSLLSSEQNHLDSLLDEWRMEFALGGALFLAGLAAFYGDRWWLSNAYQVVQADGIRHSKTSARLAAVSWIVGLVTMIGVLLKVFLESGGH